MTLEEALNQCDQYARGHPVAKDIARRVADRMWRDFGVLPSAGTIGQVTFPTQNFVCIDMVCRRKPSVTISLCGQTADYAHCDIAHLFVRPRRGSVRIRTRNGHHRFAAMRAFVRAAAIATGATPPQLPPNVKNAKQPGPATPAGEPAAAGSASPAKTPPTSAATPTPRPTAASPSIPKPPSPLQQDPSSAPVANRPGLDRDSDVDIPKAANSDSPPNGGGGADAGIVGELRRIAILIGEKRPVSLHRAATAIQILRQTLRPGSPWLGKVRELVEIWRLMRQEMERDALCREVFFVSYQATEILPPGKVIPSRPAQLGASTAPLPSEDAVERWLDATMGTEDGIRQFCCFAWNENESIPRPQPLIVYRGTRIEGAKVAALYRERRMDRSWDPKRPVDMAMLHDFVIAHTIVDAEGRWTPRVMRACVRRLRPYLRSIPDVDLIPAALNAVGFLEGRGLMHEWTSKFWSVRAEGHKLFDQHIGPAWLAANNT